MRAVLVAPVIAGCLCLFSCHTTRQSAPAVSSGQEWSRMKAPVTLRIEEPVRASVGAQMTMVADSAISLSARFMGMEVFSLQIAGDSVTVVEKMNRRYFAESLREFLAKVPVSVGDLQSVLTGRPVRVPSPLPGGVECRITGSDSLMSAFTVMRPDKEPVRIEYGSPVETPYGTMASLLTISAPFREGRRIKATIEWNYPKAKWNSDVDFRPVKINGSYTRFSVKDAAWGVPVN